MGTGERVPNIILDNSGSQYLLTANSCTVFMGEEISRLLSATEIATYAALKSQNLMQDFSMKISEND